MSAHDLSGYLAIAAWITGNASAVLAIGGCFARRNADWALFGLVILTLVILANACIVRLFI